jgi:hypothetical protein
LLQHLQAGLLEDTRCFGKLNPLLALDARMFYLFFQSQPWILFESSFQPLFLYARNLPADLFRSQFDPDFQTPLILGESLDLSDSEESQFVGAFSDGLWAKSEPILSMSAFQKPTAGGILGEWIGTWAQATY